MQIKQDILNYYENRTAASKAKDKNAKLYLPGGDTRWSTYFLPYPTYMEDGNGCTLKDLDGNTYVDYVNNYTSLIHGHCNPSIKDSIMQSLSKPVISGSPHENQYQLAKLITERVPGIDTLRYTNSGTEASMMAMRTARIYKKRDIIIKMDGGYHGSHDFVEVNITPDLSGNRIPVSKTENIGISPSVLDSIKVARFNDLESVDELLKKYQGQVAAIIIEPVLNAGGVIPATLDFLHGVRELANKYDSLLIFDEIVTFRMSTGGMQKLTEVIPDITVLGKIIGGGFAIGAFGGKKEIMNIYSPDNHAGFHHSGTFNGHNVTMSAGLAALKLLDDDAIAHINALGSRMHEGIELAFSSLGITGKVTSCGSLLQLHWTDKTITEAKDMSIWKRIASDVPRMFHLELLNRGIFATTRGMFNISTPMNENIVDETVNIIEDTLRYLKPYIKEEAPLLVK